MLVSNRQFTLQGRHGDLWHRGKPACDGNQWTATLPSAGVRYVCIGVLALGVWLYVLLRQKQVGHGGLRIGVRLDGSVVQCMLGPTMLVCPVSAKQLQSKETATVRTCVKHALPTKGKWVGPPREYVLRILVQLSI